MEILTRSSFRSIFLFTPKELKRFYVRDFYLKKAIDDFRVLYIDNHIVINSRKNLAFYDGKLHLSPSALENMHESCISKQYLNLRVKHAHYYRRSNHGEFIKNQ